MIQFLHQRIRISRLDDMKALNGGSTDLRDLSYTAESNKALSMINLDYGDQRLYNHRESNAAIFGTGLTSNFRLLMGVVNELTDVTKYEMESGLFRWWSLIWRISAGSLRNLTSRLNFL